MKNKCRKSHYKIKSKFVYYKIVTMVLLLTMLAVAYLFRHTKGLVISFMIINIINLIYFLIRTKYVLNNLKNNELVLTRYSKKIFTIHKCAVIYYLIAVCICNIIYAYGIYTNNYDIKIWKWYAILLPIMYSDTMYLSGITAFGKNSFASGEYVVDYSDIVDVKEIISRDTREGTMLLISLWGKNGELGYDKLFVEEYQKLRLKVYQEQ